MGAHACALLHLHRTHETAGDEHMLVRAAAVTPPRRDPSLVRLSEAPLCLFICITPALLCLGLG